MVEIGIILRGAGPGESVAVRGHHTAGQGTTRVVVP